MPEAELQRMPRTTDMALEPLAALLAADVVAVHLSIEDGEPGLEISILEEAAPEEVRSQCVDLRTFLRERLAPLPAAERAEVLALLDVVAAPEPASEDPVSLSASRALVREALRDPLPASVVERDEPQGLHFDSVLALAEDAFYVRGWARDGQAPLRRLTVVSPEGSRTELLPGIHREPRPDVDSFYEEPARTGAEGTGFLGYCETGSPSLLSS